MTYRPDPSLQKYLESGNLPMARALLRVILDKSSLPDQEATEAFEWAVAQRPDLLESIDVRMGLIDVDRSHWSPDYYFLQASRTSENFSRERFEHLIAVRNYLRSIRAPGFVFVPGQPSVATKVGKRKVLIVAAVGIVILALVVKKILW